VLLSLAEKIVHVILPLADEYQTTKTLEKANQFLAKKKCQMAVYRPGFHPQNIIWTEAKLRSIYYFVGDRPVHKLPVGPKCHELFAMSYSIHANLSDDMFLLLYI
jgi:hypothetical protein